ncbi:MAG TPA: carboxypeptidase-like regulatory domain-containing protein [Holophaga sp.]|nr:carboxypeptidase-like regulatory domain-containing protein [Holophaga sp.]
MRSSRMLFGGLALVGVLTGCGGSGQGPGTPRPPMGPGLATGRVVDPATGLGLPGVRVQAQARGTGSGQPLPLNHEVLGTGFTDADGAFILRGLPLDRAFRLVAQPDLPSGVHDLAVSPVLTATSQAPETNALLVAPAAGTGSITLEVPALLAPARELRLYGVPGAAANGEAFLLRLASPEPGRFMTLDRVPAGNYLVVVNAWGRGPEGGAQTATSQAIAVQAGQAAPLDPTRLFAQ